MTLDGPVNLAEIDDYLDDIAPDLKSKVTEFWAGEVDFKKGFYADLLFTFRHEGICLVAKFTANSDILITGSSDATCRLWSSRRGDLLFQINAPAAVIDIVTVPVAPGQTDLFAVCENRLLVCRYVCSCNKVSTSI